MNWSWQMSRRLSCNRAHYICKSNADSKDATAMRSRHGDHTTTCAPGQRLRGECGVTTGAKSLHLYVLREGCATNECRGKGTLDPAYGVSWLAISDRSFGYSAISMRRFAVRPSSVSFPARGLVSA